jgi:hypothetical protein
VWSVRGSIIQARSTCRMQHSFVGNKAGGGTCRTIYNGGTISYVLPAPLGYHVLNGFLCEVQQCAANDGSTILCPVQSCDYARHGGKWVAHIIQGGNCRGIRTRRPRG